MDTTKFSIHPLIIFWLGVLTGAIIVGLVFVYKTMAPAQYESSVLTAPKTYFNQYKSNTLKGGYTLPLNTEFLGNPDGE